MNSTERERFCLHVLSVRECKPQPPEGAKTNVLSVFYLQSGLPGNESTYWVNFLSLLRYLEP